VYIRANGILKCIYGPHTDSSTKLFINISVEVQALMNAIIVTSNYPLIPFKETQYLCNSKHKFALQ